MAFLKQLPGRIALILMFGLGVACSTTVKSIASEPANSVRGESSFVAPAPEDLFIYQIFIDRFANGDPSNDDGNPRAGHDPGSPYGFHGGDLAGIRQKLPYIASLGANAIWITPFVENVNDYHGYGAYDWYNVDPNFGTLEEMQALVSDAHAHGIAVFFDLVAGHMGNLIGSNDPGYPGYLPPPNTYDLSWRSGLRYPAPFDSLEYFHAHGHIGSFTEPEQELGELSDLDDLKTETQYVREQMAAVWTYWIEQTGVDGFRVDTVKHVDLGFWEYFLPRIRQVAANQGKENFFIFGEIFGAGDDFMRKYLGTLNSPPYKFDAAVDFPFYYESQEVFARASRPPASIAQRLESRAANLGPHHLQMPNFIDNHDVRRFLNVASDDQSLTAAERIRRLELGLVFLMTAPGPPIIYYGTEQGFDGGNDPFNREDMYNGLFESGPSVGDNFDVSSPLYQYVARLAGLRRELAPLRRGEFSRRMATDSGPGLLAYTRDAAEDSVFVVLNTSESALPLPETQIPAFENLEIVNALQPSERLLIAQDGILPARSIPGHDAEIWLPANLLPPSPPAVLAFSPVDGEDNVSTERSAAVVEFRSPMNESVTTAAISIDPPTSHTITWGPDFRTATMELHENLSARTEYTVSVSTAAESADGENMPFAASASWTTGREPIDLPPLPPAVTVHRKQHSITIDGKASEWPSLQEMSPSSSRVLEGQSYAWKDAIGDDDGPGGYVYPTNSAFTGEDADIAEFRFAFDESSLYFLIRAVSTNPDAGFFTPYFGIAIDTGSGADAVPLGYDQGGGSLGIAELEIRPDATPDFEIIYTGPGGANLIGSDKSVGFISTAAHSQSTGVVEIEVPRNRLGLGSEVEGKLLNLVVYSGLETFGGMREIAAFISSWEPGGGSTSLNDPDVFDLAGADGAKQMADLSDYDDTSTTLIVNSIISVSISDTEPTGGPMWMIY